MSAPVPALYYDGAQARPLPVGIEPAPDGALRVSGDGLELVVPLAEIEPTTRLGRIRRVLRLPGGASVHCDDNDAIDALFPGRSRLERVIERLERHVYAVAASVVVTVGTLGLGLFVVLPRLAERVASQIPPGVERAMGAQVETVLGHMGFEQSGLDADRISILEAEFEDIRPDVPGAEHYRVEFRKAATANAFALPGGLVVVTDALCERLENEEVVAVLAHELGHQVHRHVLRSVLQDSAAVLLVTLVTGDASSASTLTATIPAVLLEAGYSRAFEREADQYAFALLRSHDRSPALFASALQKLSRDRGRNADDEGEGQLDYLSSHPADFQRVAAALAAAREFEAERQR